MVHWKWFYSHYERLSLRPDFTSIVQSLFMSWCPSQPKSGNTLLLLDANYMVESSGREVQSDREIQRKTSKFSLLFISIRSQIKFHEFSQKNKIKCSN